MKHASISELKANLSRYLREVKRGNEIEVLDRGVPIARLVPLTGGSSQDQAARQRLIRDGLLTPGKGGIEALLALPPVKLDHGALSDALDEERADRV